MFKIVSGPRMNLLGLGAPYGSSGQYGPASAAADSAYPLTNAYDGKPSSPFKLAATTSGVYVTFPNNLIPNGDFEQGVVGWVAFNCTPTSDGSFVWKGAKSAKVVTSNASSSIYRRDVITQAGQWLQLRVAIKSDGTNAVQVYVHNLATDRYLQSDGSWASGGPAVSYTSATMAAVAPIAFQVEDLATVGTPTVGIEVVIAGSANGQTYYVDECLLVPGFNFVGVFGHGFQASTGLVVYASGADYWHSPVYGNTQLLGQDGNRALVRQSAHVIQDAMAYDPFPEVYLIPGGAWGTSPTPNVPWVGEMVVGQAVALTRNPDYPVAIEPRYPNVRYKSSGGAQWVMPRGAAPLRRVTVSFAYHNDAEYREGRDNLYGMSGGGAYPLILIPTETDPGEAIYGRVEDSTAFTRVGYGERRAEFIVEEEPGPWV